MQEQDGGSPMDLLPENNRRASSTGRRASYDRRQSSAKAIRAKPLPEASVILSQQLQARLVTASSKNENPHIDIGTKRKHETGKLAPLPNTNQRVLCY